MMQNVNSVCTINAKYTISIDHPKNEAQGGLSGLSPLRSDVSRDSQAWRLDQISGIQLHSKTKLIQGGLPGTSLLSSDGPCGNQAGGLTALTVATVLK
jgi:hypothetical protein